MKTQLCILSAVFIAATKFLLAQENQVVEWQRPLGGSEYDYPQQIIKTSDGNLIGVFQTRSTDGDVTESKGGLDVWVIKFDTASNILWQKSYGGENDDLGFKVIEDDDGGFVIYAYTYSSGGDVLNYHGGRDNWIFKIDFVGNLLWSRAFGGTEDENPSTIMKLPSGNFLTTSSTNSEDGDVINHHGTTKFADGWAVEFDDFGNMVWQRALGGSADDFTDKIKLTADGNFLLTGLTNSNNGDVTNNHGDYDAWIVKLSSSGELMWQKTFGGDGIDGLSDLLTTADGNYITAGSTRSSLPGQHGSADVWIVKFDTAGQMLWQGLYGGSSTEYSFKFISTNDGGYLSIGVTYSSDGDVVGHHGGSIEDYWVIKIDADGNLLWQNSLGGTDVDFPTDVIQTNSGHYVVAGYSKSDDGDVEDPLGGFDFWLPELNQKGKLVSEQSYGGSHDEFAPFFVEISPSQLLVKGSTESGDGDVSGFHGETDAWLLMLHNIENCEVPADAFTSDISATSARVNWNEVSTASGYSVVYKIEGSNEWTTVFSGDASKKLTGLISDTHYEWSVKSLCSVSPLKVSEWMSVQHFTTAPLRSEAISTNSSQFSAFPNPTSTTITLSLPSNQNTILSIFNLLGEKVKEEKVTGKEVTMDVSLLPQGVYLVRMENSVVGKFVKE